MHTTLPLLSALPTLTALAALAFGAATAATAGASADTTALSTLNSEYIRSVRESDVAWFDRNLAPDFYCTNPNGTIVNREQFLKQTAIPQKVSKLDVDEVNIRVMGDFALIHARVIATLPDGQTASRRYTDAWARRDGRWVAVSAHITPVQ
ncbi:MAG TPA: nuclear transport factor 2 family protein [Vicinamibacterales bacterium]|jgi:ketosteroid isomerase-like protein|nr:nuclear transport factor 2 family protein [Vicinamibacterales bacterium]